MNDYDEETKFEDHSSHPEVTASPSKQQKGVPLLPVGQIGQVKGPSFKKKSGQTSGLKQSDADLDSMRPTE